MSTLHHKQSPSGVVTRYFKIDLPLLGGLLALLGISMTVLWSAGGQDMALIQRQVVRWGFAAVVMLVMAQFKPRFYQRLSMPIYLGGLVMLVCVLLFGDMGKGAQRWLDLGVIRFQPSEIMKLAVPITVCAFLAGRSNPPRFLDILAGLLLVIVPTLLIARQPDLGTSLLVASSGIFALFLGGMSWKLILLGAGSVAAFAPVMWFYLMHPYQRQRVLTFLNPESDPLGSGYHIIQSKIAIGSGGLHGKGWQLGTQSQLEFLPERHTDFIFSVFSEEFGLIGVLSLMLLYLFVIGRGLLIAVHARNTFNRLLAGSLILTFFVYVFVNVGMVSGVLPVVGVPLPLVSYGGTSIVTLMAGFGLLMSIHADRPLIKP